MSNILRAEKSIDICMDMFVARMDEMAASGEDVDVAKWTQW
jgi:hypothetical protein